MICPLNIFQTTNLQVYCPLCFCLSLPYFSFSYTQQTCQSVRRACWSSATCFRVWRSCTGPILLRLSRHCRSVRYPWFISLDMQSRVAHYNCDLILGLRNWQVNYPHRIKHIGWLRIFGFCLVLSFIVSLHQLFSYAAMSLPLNIEYT